MDAEKLKAVLERHKKWVTGDDGGESANLWYANLQGEDLQGADLRGANLQYANLRYANLQGADLRGANLWYANLRGADLRDANLRGADLQGADLRSTNLRYANLRYADLQGADLRSADLQGAYLLGADLYNAKNLQDAIGLFWPACCPEKGAYVGWKKAGGMIVELEITDDALRSSATGRKCRASKARVLSITSINGTRTAESVCSDYDKMFVYRVGETVEVADFDKDRWKECAPGIHHFITREEAVRYG